MVGKKPTYVKLKRPSDVMSHVQTLINRIRRSGKELDEIKSTTNLLNTWIAAYKVNLESSEIDELKEELATLKDQIAKSNETYCKIMRGDINVEFERD
jgi:peptidoglycan hydrolase CwlO-like protein